MSFEKFQHMKLCNKEYQFLILFIKYLSFYRPIFFSLAATGTVPPSPPLSKAAASLFLIYNIAGNKLFCCRKPVHKTLLDTGLLISDSGNQI
jgi:hypothetical protein